MKYVVINVYNREIIKVGVADTPTEATKIMNEKKITNLFVVEGKLPIGVIHIHDCLNNKVV